MHVDLLTQSSMSGYRLCSRKLMVCGIEGKNISIGGRKRAIDVGMLTRSAHVAWRRCGFGIARSWGCPTPSLPLASPFPSCSSA